MKLEQYAKAQSGQGIRELTHEFFEYHQTTFKKSEIHIGKKLIPRSQQRCRYLRSLAHE